MAAKGVLRTIEGDRLGFWCPGCEEMHAVRLRPAPSPSWSWNGSYDAPTFRPSILVRSGHYLPEHKGPECWCTFNAKRPDETPVFECSVCHSFVTDGKIQFLGDCTHKLAGKTVPLEAREEC
jgi:hypothetical protein